MASTWTDDELRVAVASQRSWKGVATSLGAKPTNSAAARAARRRSEELGIDASHFTGLRKWSDRQLRRALDTATSWEELSELLGINDSPDLRVRIKGQAVRMGLDISRLQLPSSPSPSLMECVNAPLEPKSLRVAAPAIVMAWFMLHGLDVALPVEPQEYDLLVTMPDGIQRVQVKSTTSRHKGKWQVGVGRRPYSLDKTAGHAPYDPDSLDYFCIVDGDGGIYLIPSRVLAGRTRINADSYPGYKVGDASSLLAVAGPVSAVG